MTRCAMLRISLVRMETIQLQATARTMNLQAGWVMMCWLGVVVLIFLVAVEAPTRQIILQRWLA